MKKITIVFVLLSGFMISTGQPSKTPHVEITNGVLKAHLYLPDSENGYYRATRFDWSGIVSSLEYKGHTYFGKWFDEDNPPPSATIMGPVEAYSPLNFNKVEPGSDFVQIGVGAMTKPSNEKHNAFNTYTIVDPGTWEIKKKANEVQFVHILKNEDYSYEYTKTVQLIPGQPKMVISHSLKNTGEKRISTSGFNHNFFVIDNQPIDKGLELTFPVNVSGTGRGDGDMFEINGKKIIFKRTLAEDESFACKYVEGINSVEDFDIRVDNLNTGAGVRITGDQPISRLRLWGNSKTVCPETYIDLKVESGEEFSWSYFYEFYER